MLSTKILIGLAVALGALALAGPPYLLLLARYPLVIFQGDWSLAGVRIDPIDLVIAMLLLRYFLHGKPEDTRIGRFPYMLPWLTLGLLLTISYLSAPANQEHLTAVHRAGYQLYRYGWKSILFFPLALLLLDSRIKMERALIAVVLAADLLALHATIQGYTLGIRARGPLNHPNAMAAALVAPFLLSLIGSLSVKTRFRLLWIGSSLLMLRGLLFTGSRGGIVAVVAGICFCAAWLLTRRTGRARIAALAPAALVVGALTLWIKPDLLQRPTIQRAMTAREGMGSDTVQWRLHQRWPRFIETIAENPWLGTGTAVDAQLAAKGGAATPHNGYLALAVAHGVPAALVYTLLALLALRNGILTFRHSDDEWTSLLGLVIAAALIGILVHNLVDATLRMPFVRDLFWMLCAFSARTALVLSPRPGEAGHVAPKGALLHGLSR